MDQNKVLEITISTQALRQAVAIAGAVVQPNAIVPAMEQLLFEVLDKGKLLQVTGSGNSISVVTNCEYIELATEDFDKNSFTMPYATLYALLKELPEAPLVVTYYFDQLQLTDAHRVVINESDNEYEFATEHPKEFLKLSKKDGETFMLSAEQLHYGLKYAKSCLGTNTDREPWTYCAYMDFTPEGGVKFVAADGLKIAVVETKDVLADGFSVKPFLVHPKLVSFIDFQLTERSVGPVTITRHEDVITVEYDNFTVNASAMVGTYPNYNQAAVVAHDYDTALNVDDLKATIRRSLIFSDTTTYVAVMDFNKTMLFVTGEDNLYGKKAKQHVVCEEVEDFTVAVSGKSLREMINAFSGASSVWYSNFSRNLVFEPMTHNCKSVTLILSTLQFNRDAGIKKK